MNYEKVLNGKKNIVFMGEAGSGKSELALNFAFSLNKSSDKKVRLFDLDQTKPIFRSRDALDALSREGVSLSHAEHFFDAPTIVGGVEVAMASEDIHAILDIGGDVVGASIIGRFRHSLNRDNTAVFFVLNPFRPWSRESASVINMAQALMRLTGVKSAMTLLNPNYGGQTQKEDVIKGYRLGKAMLPPEFSISGLCCRHDIDVFDELGREIPILPLKIYLKYDWQN